MNRRSLLLGGAGAAFSLTMPNVAQAVGILRPGALVSLKCLGSIPGPRFLDGRTGNGTVGLAPQLFGPFTGTKWKVFAGGGEIELQCQGDVDGPRFLDGRTADGSVGLAPTANRPFTGTHWRVHQIDNNNPNIVALECLGNIPGPRWLDGRTQNGSVGLAPSTDPPFSGTRWEAAFYPVQIDPGSEGHPANE